MRHVSHDFGVPASWTDATGDSLSCLGLSLVVGSVDQKDLGRVDIVAEDADF